MHLAIQAGRLTASAPRSTSLAISSIHGVAVRRGLLGSTIDVSGAGDVAMSFGGMDGAQAERFAKDVHKAARASAADAAPALLAAAARLDTVLGQDAVIRIADHLDLVDAVASATDLARGHLAATALPADAAAALKRLRGLRTQKQLGATIADLNERREARAEAALVAPLLLDAAARVDAALYEDAFVRMTGRLGLAAMVASATGRARGQLVEAVLPADASSALKRLRGILGQGQLDAAIDASNERRMRERIPAVQVAATAVLGRALSDEQAFAVASEDDSTLVLAGAGSGKTAVLVARIAYLANQGVEPARILALAFNRDAATEIRTRLPDRLRDVAVHTFHSFGLAVIGQATGARPRIATVAQDRMKYAETMAAIVDDLAAQPALAKQILRLVAHPAHEWHDAFDFPDPGSYYEWVRQNELRTLSGDLVKSIEELDIANFLTLHKVPFEYEAPYAPMRSGTVNRVPYRPDFKLLPDLYIEHFALDRAGHAPPGWHGYEAGVEWKRALHRQHGTRLIETQSWQHREGTLNARLDQRLRESGIHPGAMEATEAVRNLAQRQVSRLAVLLGTMLLHRKASRASVAELAARAQAHPDPVSARAMVSLLDAAGHAYEQYLASEEAVDFQDLIIQSTDAITSGSWPSPFSEVLVDEAQDLSHDRMGLLAALHRRGGRVFMSGDDKQSVNAFSGADVALMRNPDPHLGPTARRGLSKTWRHGNDIARPANAFVMEDPQQIQQPMAGIAQTGRGVTVVAAHTPHEGVRVAFDDIRSDQSGEADVLMLGRYRNSFGAVPLRAHSLRLRNSTVHAAKGQEADYVVVLGLNNERRGFPSRIDDDPLLRLVLPSRNADGALPWAEERRLFYVALTRARRGVWLIADARHPSDFVTELQRKHGVTRTIGDSEAVVAAPCRGCGTGRMLPGNRGSYYCSHFPLCRYSPPRCSRCQRDSILQGDDGRLRCATCEAVFASCPDCRLGVLVLRRARGGAFRGCSQYGKDRPCEYTTGPE